MDRRPGCVLVAEDDPSLLLLHRIWLEGEGYEVSAAADGVEALATIAADGLPEAAILDVEMPRIDGLDVCRFLRMQSAGMPIVFVTALDDVRDNAFAAGATDVLGKPSDLEQLMAILRDASRAAAA